MGLINKIYLLYHPIVTSQLILQDTLLQWTKMSTRVATSTEQDILELAHIWSNIAVGGCLTHHRLLSPRRVR